MDTIGYFSRVLNPVLFGLFTCFTLLKDVAEGLSEYLSEDRREILFKKVGSAALVCFFEGCNLMVVSHFYFINKCTHSSLLKLVSSLPPQEKGVQGLDILHIDVIFLVLYLWSCLVAYFSLSTNHFKPFRRTISGSPGFYAFNGFFIYA